MKTTQLRAIAGSAILACSLLSSAHAYAADDCAILPQAEVIKAFNDPALRLNQADPAGMCNWSLSNNSILMASVQKRPKASEAKAIYDSYMATTFAELKHNASKPAVGQQAYFGMSAQNADSGQAGFISLQGDTLFILHYLGSGKLDDSVAAPLLALGRLGSAKKHNAAQTYGKCEWFTADEMAKLLGKGTLTVQRLAENHCIASVNPSGAALTASTSPHASDTALGNMKETAQKSCTVVPLPTLGSNAHAVFDCATPGNNALSVNFIKKDRHVMFIYAPPNRAANKGDVKALEGLLQRAYDRL